MSALRRSNEALQDNDDACLYASLKCRAWGAGNPVSGSYGCGNVYLKKKKMFIAPSHVVISIGKFLNMVSEYCMIENIDSS